MSRKKKNERIGATREEKDLLIKRTKTVSDKRAEDMLKSGKAAMIGLTNRDIIDGPASKGTCEECKGAVYYGSDMPAKKFICNKCFLKAIREDPKFRENMKIELPESQLDDIMLTLLDQMSPEDLKEVLQKVADEMSAREDNYAS